MRLVPPDDVVTMAEVNVTGMKFANGTWELPSTKSSTIHSASDWHRCVEDVTFCDTDLPVVKFSIWSVPAVREVTEAARRICWPAETAKLKKSTAAAGTDWHHGRQF